jgi:hypothetical protein
MRPSTRCAGEHDTWFTQGGSASSGSGRVDGGKGDVAQRHQMTRTTVNQGRRGQQRRGGSGSYDETCSAVVRGRSRGRTRCADEAGEQGRSPPRRPHRQRQRKKCRSLAAPGFGGGFAWATRAGLVVVA